MDDATPRRTRRRQCGGSYSVPDWALGPRVRDRRYRARRLPSLSTRVARAPSERLRARRRAIGRRPVAPGREPAARGAETGMSRDIEGFETLDEVKGTN